MPRLYTNQWIAPFRDFLQNLNSEAFDAEIQSICGYIYIYIYMHTHIIYIYIYICVCTCVCERDIKLFISNAITTVRLFS